MPPIPPVTYAIFLRSVIGTLRSSFDAHCNPHATADAQARDALLRVALAHLVEQSHQDAATRRTDRVTDRDRTAVDVDLARVPAHLVVDGAGLRRERLVDLEQVEVLRLPAGALERLAGRRHRAHSHDRRVERDGRVARDP